MTSPDYEAGWEALSVLRADFSSGNRNEATTRLQLIDRLFFECLGWSVDDCIPEQSQDGEYADYTFLAPTRLLIVEAKREGISFDLPAGVTKIEHKLPVLMRDYPDVGKAIRQAAGYCQSRGVQFGAVANGHQIVAFIATRHDSPPLEGRALAFSSFDAMLENFLALWNALSKPAIMERLLLRTLAGEMLPALPPKLAASIPGYPGTKARNPFQADLQIVSELVLEDIAASPELETTFLAECYCESGALSEYSLISRDLIQARYSALFDQSAPGPATTPAVARGGELSADLLADSLSRRPILLIGDVGVGKTTFIRHLMKVAAPEQFSKAIAIHLNLGSQGALAMDLREFIVDEIARQLRELFDVDVDSDGLVRAAYHGELQRFAKGIYGRLKEIDAGAYMVKEIEFLAARVADRTEHLRYVLEHLSKGRRQQVVLFLDNADQRDFETQQQAFLIAEELAAQWPAMVFVTLRPETYHQSLRAGGALSGYHPKAFTIAPPRIDRVIERRLHFALRITTGELAIPGLRDIRLNLGRLDSIIRALLGTLSEKDDVGVLIDNVAAGNVRLALDIVRGFLGSGHVDTEKIVRIFADNGRYLIPLHEFVRAVMYGDQVHYDPTRSYVANLFDVTTEDPKDHFLLPVMLTEIASWKGAEAQHGFVETSLLYAKLQSYGYLANQIDAAVARAYRHRLIETVARRTPKPGLELPPSIRNTSVGVYHITYLCHLFAYVDAVIVDTPILDPAIRRSIGDVEFIADRLERGRRFVEYLDREWESLEGEMTAFRWRDVSQNLWKDMDRVRTAVERAAVNRRQSEARRGV